MRKKGTRKTKVKAFSYRRKCALKNFASQHGLSSEPKGHPER